MPKITIKPIHNSNCVTFYFNKECLSLINHTHLVIDKVNLRIREATIDDKKYYKLNFLKESGATITCELPNKDELIGDYDVEDKKKYLELFKI